jgi:hypothetical protein
LTAPAADEIGGRVDLLGGHCRTLEASERFVNKLANLLRNLFEMLLNLPEPFSRRLCVMRVKERRSRPFSYRLIPNAITEPSSNVVG